MEILKPLNICQKQSIENMDFYFYKLLSIYHQWYGLDYINVFDNDMVFAINYGKPLYREVSPYLMKNRYLLQLIRTTHVYNLTKHIHQMWCVLSYKKKHDVYIYLMDRLYEFS